MLCLVFCVPCALRLISFAYLFSASLEQSKPSSSGYTVIFLRLPNREAFSFLGGALKLESAETLKNPSESEIDTNALDRSWGQCVLPSGLCAGAH